MDVALGKYSRSVNVFNWATREKVQTIKLGLPEGSMPFEIRFPHDPNRPDAFFCTALGSSIYRMTPKEKGSLQYEATCLIKIPLLSVSNWDLPLMPAFVTDLLLSMDDRFLYFTTYLHGDVRQYDISDPENPKLTGQVYP
ncbi:unnamed protein product, partial [Mesorhabditis spiculigera]